MHIHVVIASRHFFEAGAMAHLDTGASKLRNILAIGFNRRTAAGSAYGRSLTRLIGKSSDLTGRWRRSSSDPSLIDETNRI